MAPEVDTHRDAAPAATPTTAPAASRSAAAAPNLDHEAFAAATHFATRTNTPRRERAS